VRRGCGGECGEECGVGVECGVGAAWSAARECGVGVRRGKSKTPASLTCFWPLSRRSPNEP
jgi:hypothetical protein